VASTLGWDVVFAVRGSAVNRKLATATGVPATFSGPYTTPSESGTITGTFGPWQIEPGAGSPIGLVLPMSSLAITSSAGTRTLTVLTAHATLSLLGSVAGATRTITTDPSQPVTVLSITGTIGVMDEAILKVVMKTWLAANLDKVDALFAALEFDGQVATIANLAWLQPTSFEYAITPGGTDFTFGVLGQTEGRSTAGLPVSVDGSLIRSGEDAALAITSERFLTKILQPSATRLFPAATIDSFAVVKLGTTLWNVMDLTFQPLTMGTTTVTDATIAAHGVTMEIAGEELVMTFDSASWSYSAGVTAYLKVASTHTLGLDSHRIVTLATKSMQPSGSISQSAGVLAATLVAAFVADLLSAAVGAVIGARMEDSAEREVEMRPTQTGADLPPQPVGPRGLGDLDAPANAAQAAGDLALGDEPAPAGFFARNAVKLRGGIIGAVAGLAVAGPVGAAGEILEAIADGNINKVPTIDDWARTAISSMNFGVGDFTPVSAGFADGFRVGGTVR
jgi:hypothetical protein